MADIKTIAWNETAEEHLKDTMVNDPIANLDDIKSFVKQGYMGLFGVFRQKKQVGTFVVKIDVGSQGKELVIVLGGGEPQKKPLFESCLNFWIEEAKRKNCKSIRFHTQRKGFEKKAVVAGFYKAEVVYRKDVI